MKTTYPAPVENILDGVTDKVTARESLGVVKTNMTDDSISLNYGTGAIYARWGSSDGEIIDLNGSVTDGGISLRHKVNDKWEIVPQSIGFGGTGATGIEEKDLTYNGISFIAHKWGPVVMITSTTGKTTSAITANNAIGTLPAGYRPKVMVDVLDTSTPAQERWVIDTSGHIQPTVAVAKDTPVRLTATYLTY